MQLGATRVMAVVTAALEAPFPDRSSLLSFQLRLLTFESLSCMLPSQKSAKVWLCCHTLVLAALWVQSSTLSSQHCLPPQRMLRCTISAQAKRGQPAVQCGAVADGVAGVRGRAAW